MRAILVFLCILPLYVDAFITSTSSPRVAAQMKAAPSDDGDVVNADNQRRWLLSRTVATAAAIAMTSTTISGPAEAIMFLDPQMYGDQENRVSAVDSLRESVRRTILLRPVLAPAFYILALMDGLSYDAKTKEGGPDGDIIRRVLSTDKDTPFIRDLKEASLALVASKKSLVKLTAITIGDAVALGGAEAVAAIGGPILPVQLGRMDLPATQKPAVSSTYSPPRLDLFSGNASLNEITMAFRKSGLTEREMTALLAGLLTINTVEKSRSNEEWARSSRPKFRERGKIGRMDEYKRLTDEDIAKATSEEDDDEEDSDDDGWYIADTFGTRDQVFGNKATGDIDQKTFNKYLQDLNQYNAKRASVKADQPYGWIGDLLLDKETPSVQSWLEKYSTSVLNYEKDLTVAFNSMTQLGAEYTGGKYESLLKNKPRRTLNN